MMMNDKKRDIATIIVGRMSPKKQYDSNHSHDEYSSHNPGKEEMMMEDYKDKGDYTSHMEAIEEALGHAMGALKEGNVKKANMALSDWHELVHEYEDMNMKKNSEYDYKEQES